MKLKHLLALIVILLTGSNAWAEDVTIGDTNNTTGYLEAKSEAFALNGNGTWKFNFTNYNAGNGSVWNNFLLEANDGSADKFVLRADQWEIVAGSNANITRPGYNWVSNEQFVTDMNGAEVDMTVSRIGNVIYVNSTITPSNGTAAFKYNYVYTSAAGNLDLYLSVDHSHLVLHEAKEYNNVYANDYENSSTITDIKSGDYTSSQITDGSNHYLKVRENGRNGGNASLTFPDYSSFDEYVLGFKVGFYTSNNKGSSLQIKNGSTTLATFGWGSWGNNGNVVSYTIGNSLQSETLLAVNQSSSTRASDTSNSITKWYTFIITADKTSDKVLLTVNDGSSNVISSSVIGTSYININSLYFNLGNAHAEIGFDDMILSALSSNEFIENPVISVTGVNNTERTISISSSLTSSGNATKTYYTTDGTDPDASSLEYTTPFTLTSSCIVKAISYKNGNMSIASEIVSNTVDCSALTLVAPSYTKGAYTAGVTTVTLNANESSVLLNPTATIHYSTSAGADGDIAAGASIDVADGVTVTAYAKATGYTNSANLVFTTAAPCTYPTIVTETYNGRVSANWGFILGDESTEVAGYHTLTYNDGVVKTVSENLLVNKLNGGGNDLMRPNGVYFAAGTNVAIPNVKAGDVITFNGIYGNAAFNVSTSSNATKDAWNSNEGSKYVFTVTTDGVANFNIARYGYTQSLTIQRDVVFATMSVNAAAKYGTFCAPFDVVLPAGVDSYTADVAEGKIVLTEGAKAGETLTAHTPVVLKAAEGLASTTFYGKATSGTPIAGALTGVYELTETPTGAYLLQMNNNVVGFYNVDGLGTHIGANRCYLTATSGARAFLFDGDETAINSIEANSTADVIFDLAGRKVMNAKKGLYIVNGKKVIR